MILAFGLILSALAVLSLISAVLSAPRGREDAEGFHFDL
jgi:hypothetical protein